MNSHNILEHQISLVMQYDLAVQILSEETTNSSLTLPPREKTKIKTQRCTLKNVVYKLNI